MAEFLQSQRGLLTEGLFGGTLTTAFDGFTVPATWTVEFSQLTGSGNLTMQWESRFTQSAVNMQMPPNLFQVD